MRVGAVVGDHYFLVAARTPAFLYIDALFGTGMKVHTFNGYMSGKSNLVAVFINHI
jgi:hypothetical protein